MVLSPVAYRSTGKVSSLFGSAPRKNVVVCEWQCVYLHTHHIFIYIHTQAQPGFIQKIYLQTIFRQSRINYKDNNILLELSWSCSTKLRARLRGKTKTKAQYCCDWRLKMLAFFFASQSSSRCPGNQFSNWSHRCMDAKVVGALPVSWSGGPTLNPGAPLMQI